uniref:Uncharacterized protein n=1 Tax=Aegilops tauschii subsp. strangulata TaxID=200361 RepID=A0A453RDX3_AEGTS
ADVPLDPMKELTRLLSEQKIDEAFTMALQRSDVSMVSWLCSQVLATLQFFKCGWLIPHFLEQIKRCRHTNLHLIVSPSDAPMLSLHHGETLSSGHTTF